MSKSNLMVRSAALAAAVALGLMMGGAAAMAAPGECAFELDAVRTAIGEATFLGRRAEMDETNLLAKVEAAESKVALDKYSDAIDKLLDVSDTATALADAPKPKLDDATGINNAVTVAIDCVGSLGM